jgi:hypothetical protein
MTKTITFEGIPGGDGECYCWNVDLETYKHFDRNWEEEIKYRQDVNIDNGFPKDEGVYDEFKIYPSHIDRVINASRKKYKITVTYEEIA